MLVNEGLSVTMAGYGLSAYNFGGVLGALFCALSIDRFGSRWPMLLCCLGGAVSAWICVGISAVHQPGMLIFLLGLHGLFVNAVQSTMSALCAYIYPAGIRATGIAGAFAVGRVGSIVSAFAGTTAITAGGASGYLILLGAAMTLVLVVLAAVHRHIPVAGAAP